MNSNNRITATLFPRDIVYLRNISINTLHKGDDDDDDDDNNNNNNKCILACQLSGGGLPLSPVPNNNRLQQFTPTLTEHCALLMSLTFCNSMADR